MNLVNYIVNRQETALQYSGKLYDYILAANGVFLRAARENLKVCFPIAKAKVRGIETCETSVCTGLPRVPGSIVKRILSESIAACVNTGAPVEALFHLCPTVNGGWQCVTPEQKATGVAVRPTDAAQDGSSYERALIEMHSHHQMKAFFSAQDNADEQGFRLYAVIGEIFTRPVLRVRVGCYGYFYEIPASEIFELPEGVYDYINKTTSGE